MMNLIQINNIKIMFCTTILVSIEESTLCTGIYIFQFQIYSTTRLFLLKSKHFRVKPPLISQSNHKFSWAKTTILIPFFHGPMGKTTIFPWQNHHFHGKTTIFPWQNHHFHGKTTIFPWETHQAFPPPKEAVNGSEPCSCPPATARWPPWCVARVARMKFLGQNPWIFWGV